MTPVTLVYTYLLVDDELESFLPGGIYNGELVQDINRQATPSAYDTNMELMPSVIVKPELTTPWGPHHDSSRYYFVAWIYGQVLVPQMDQARERIYQLLHRTQVFNGEGIYDIRHTNDILGTEIAVLGVATIASRFVITLQRVRA